MISLLGCDEEQESDDFLPQSLAYVNISLAPSLVYPHWALAL